MEPYNGIIILQTPIEQQNSTTPSRKLGLVLLASLVLVAGAVAYISGGSLPAHSSMRGSVARNLSQQQWSGWFSDNLDSRRDIHMRGVSTYDQLGRGDGVITGLRCRQDYCDDLQARFKVPERPAGGEVSSFWSRSRGVTLSEENGGEYRCPANHFVSGLSCYGDFCDGLDIRCSQYANRPRGFCYWTNGWFSEEQGEITFRDGYFLSGLRCSGSYCDSKQFFVCIDSEEETTGTANPDDCSALANTDSAVVTGFTCTGFPCNEAENYKLTCAVPQHFGKTADFITRVDAQDSRGFINCPDGYLVKSIEESNGRPTLVCARFSTRNAARSRQNTCKFYDDMVGSPNVFSFNNNFNQQSIHFEPNLYLSGFQCTGGNFGNRNCSTRRFRVCPLF